MKDSIGKGVFGCSQRRLRYFCALLCERRGSELFFTIHRKYTTTNYNTSFCRVFVVFSLKTASKQIHAKTIWLKKMCLKARPGFEAKSISSLKKKNQVHAVNKRMIINGFSISCQT